MERKELTVKFTTNGKERQYVGIANPASRDVVKKTIHVGEIIDFLHWKMICLLDNWEQIDKEVYEERDWIRNKRI